MLLRLCFVDILYNVGGIAQLGERLHGMQEVSGSIPLTSTNLKRPTVFRLWSFAFKFFYDIKNDTGWGVIFHKLLSRKNTAKFSLPDLSSF